MLRVGFQGSRVTSDGGLLLVRELDERLGLSVLIAKNIMDGGAPDENRLNTVGAGDLEGIIAAVFEVKKEIPD